MGVQHLDKQTLLCAHNTIIGGAKVPSLKRERRFIIIPSINGLTAAAAAVES